MKGKLTAGIVPLSCFLYFFCADLGSVYAQNSKVLEPMPYGPIPTTRQLQWQETEVYSLIHYSPTTYQNKDWGYGDADPMIFAPKAFDANQIAQAAKDGGLGGLVFVAKHHDGFALWPTKSTEYNIGASPWKDGKGDMVKEFAEASRKVGLKFGVYCSPWDRNAASYGQPEYVKMYRQQISELYSNYGDLFITWHDGANGGDGYYGGARERREIDRTNYYDWLKTWGTITRLKQPNAAIFSDIGPDVRWVGNEKGFAPETSWGTITFRSRKIGQEPMPGIIDESNLGTGDRNGKAWVPAECDVPLRISWFYHPEEDNQVKSAEELFDLYCRSVGRGACLDLGLAPNLDGRLHANDVAALKQFGDLVKQTFAKNLAADAEIKASGIRGNDKVHYGTAKLQDKDRYSYWATDDQDIKPILELNLGSNQRFDLIQLRENIKLGQRIDRVYVDVWEADGWNQIADVTSIGANRIIRLKEPVQADRIRFRFAGPVSIALSEVGLYLFARN